MYKKTHLLALATHNAHKLEELRALCNNTPIDIVDNPAPDSPVENASTFIENALIKAKYCAQFCSNWVVAEDSGLCIPALDGKPGLESAHYAGPQRSQKDNIKLVLNELKKRHITHAPAYFYCMLVCIRHQRDIQPIIAEGYLHGSISFEPDGVHGFGYDPIFIPQGQSQSLAKLPTNFKQQHSHRAEAFKGLLEKINQLHTEK